MKIDQIIRTNRKTVAIVVMRDGRVVVRAPQRVALKKIEAFVEQKADWISAKQAEFKATAPKSASKEFVNGEGFWFLGQTYRLKIVDRPATPLVLDEFFCLDKAVLPMAQLVFIHWYKKQAAQIISERVAWYAAKCGIDYKQVKITSAQTRWGSCSSTGSLNFTWRLVMAPLPVIDYVVVHELMHVPEKNHGSRFWAKVKAIMPDYQQKVEWLKTNGHLLKV